MPDGKRRNGGHAMLLTIAGLLLTAVALFYLVHTFARSAAKAGGVGNLFSFDPLLFAASLATLMMHLMAAAWSWQLVCRRAGTRITYRQAFNVHFLAQVGKYIPGKVWGAVGKVGLSRTVGMSNLQTGHALVLEALLILSGCLIVSIPVVPLAAAEIGLGTPIGIAVVAAAAMAVIFTAHPGAFRRVTAIARRLTGRNLDFEDTGFSSVVRLLPLYVLVFLLQGVAFVLLARSFGLDLPWIPGAFLMPTAVGVGFLVLLSPGGLGVREVSLVWLIGLVMPGTDPGLATLVSLAALLWVTLGEAIAFVIALVSWGWRKAFRALRELREKREPS
jgi:glycosyltransferase 2 family protein